MVTGIYAGLCALLMLALSWRVVKRRREAKIGLGTGGDVDLERRVRAHANLLEYAPLALLLLLVLELSGGSAALVHALGTLLLVSRVIHAMGLTTSSGYSFGRFYGTLGTWIAIVVLAVLVIARGVMAIT